jgi:hypothetical protein
MWHCHPYCHEFAPNLTSISGDPVGRGGKGYCGNATLSECFIQHGEGCEPINGFSALKLLIFFDVSGTNQKVKIACWTEMTRRYTMRIALITFLDVI